MALALAESPPTTSSASSVMSPSAGVDSDGALLSSRTHDGTTGHAPAPSQAPPSPSQSAYTPAAAPPATNLATNVPAANATPAAAGTSTAVVPVAATTASTSRAVTPSNSTSLARTQAILTARAPATSRPSTQASGGARPRSRQLVPTSGASGSDATKKPFYEQQLVEPTGSVTHPLTQQHIQSLPLAAALAHVSRANTDALGAMKRKEYQFAYERLKRAEAFCQASVLRRDRSQVVIAMRASTYNNLAILFKSVNRLRDALWYANRALRLEINFVPTLKSDGSLTARPNPAGTHLNMCAILSSLGRHGSALLHAECALSSLYLELHQLAAQVAQAKRREAARHPQPEEDDPAAGSSPSSPASSSRVPLPSSSARSSILSLIAVAYHNAAVEQEFLKQYRASTHSYRRAHEFAAKRLGADSTLARTIEHAYEGAVNLHPLKVTAKDQSMDPHAKLTVSNTAATAASTHQPNGGVRAHNKWLIPSLENNPMTARHIPVRFVPWNQFVAVAGVNGGGGGGAGGGAGRQQQQQSRRSVGHVRRGRSHPSHEEKEQDGVGASFESPLGGGPHEYAEEDADAADQEEDGPPITDDFLRQRLMNQSAFPAHPPPPGVMNAEEETHHPPNQQQRAQFTVDGHQQPMNDEDAGYWSDPELSDLPTAGGGGVVGGGSLRPKTRQDPRTGPVSRLRGYGRPGADGASGAGPATSRSQRLLPLSTSEGKLEGALGASAWAPPNANARTMQPMPHTTMTTSDYQQPAQYPYQQLHPYHSAYSQQAAYQPQVYMMQPAAQQPPLGPYGYAGHSLPPLMPTTSPYAFQPQYAGAPTTNMHPTYQRPPGQQYAQYA